MILFNCKNRQSRSRKPPERRHSIKREPPLPIYLGLNIYSHTRKAQLVNDLFDVGMSISYKRILEIENALGASVWEQFQKEGIVCPARLRNGLFTVAAYDNLDHNPTSNTCQELFHGTGVSLFQYRTNEELGEERDVALLSPTTKGKEVTLPNEFIEIQPVTMKNDNPSSPHSPPIDIFYFAKCKMLQ